MSGLLKMLSGFDRAVAVGFAVMTLIAGLALSDRLAQGKKLNHERACIAAAIDKPGAKSEPDCAPELNARAEAYRRAAACDVAIGMDMASTHCSAEVLTVIAERASAQAELETLKADQTAYLSRADDRLKQALKRQDQDHDVLKQAPVDSDGLTVCDAQCLLRRFEDAPH